MKYLHGIHDRQGAGLLGSRPGWVVNSEEVGLDPSAQGADYTDLSSAGHGVIVRLNHSHQGQGTIPAPGHFAAFAAACASFAASSHGSVAYWMIGNEPNHEGERPGGRVIEPEEYARCYLMVREAILARRPDARFMPAAMAPFHASPIPWTEYLSRTLIAILGGGGPSAIDATNCHAYGRSMDALTITSDERMGGVLSGQYRSFRTYRDFADNLPPGLERKPAFITEFDINVAWEDRDTGVITAAYQEIDRWNREGHLPIFQGLVCFRWLAGINHIDWGMQNKPRLLDDFKRAAEHGFTAPGGGQQANQGDTTWLPHITVPAPPAPPSRPAPITRAITPRFLARTRNGVLLADTVPADGRPYYQLVGADYYPPPEGARTFGPDHHILVEVLDAQGRRKQGQPVTFLVEGKPPEVKRVDKQAGAYGVDFPMFSAGHGYGVFVGEDPARSERATGMGLGTTEQPDWNHHVTYHLVFQEVTQQANSVPKPPPVQVPTRLSLAHPLREMAHQYITQRFGENPQDYAGFGMAGHTGLDFAAPSGTPVHAADSGTAVEVGNDPQGYGLYIKLRHAWGESLYAHLSKQEVSVGQIVRQGERIGLSGWSGNVDPKGPGGAHLHFAIRINPYQRGAPYDGYSDPLPYLPAASTPTQPPTIPVDKRAIVQTLYAAAREFGIDEHLLLSLAHAESSLDPRSENRASGAKGLGQIMPGTWAEVAPQIGAGQDPFNITDNARVTAYYLAWCIRQAAGERRGLWAYVWGIGNVQSGRAVPTEVEHYATKIIHGKEVLKWARL